jgi:hypothetical protein
LATPTKSPQHFAAGMERGCLELCSVIADGLDRAAFFGFLATRFFFRGSRLLENEGVAAVFIALEIVRCGLAAKIAIYALVINEVFAGDVLRIFISSVSHKDFVSLPGNMDSTAREGKPLWDFI